MIDRLVSWCLGNRPIVLAATLLLTIVGIDAI
jgi:Cu/Ag efflux pump CusA